MLCSPFRCPFQSWGWQWQSSLDSMGVVETGGEFSRFFVVSSSSSPFSFLGRIHQGLFVCIFWSAFKSCSSLIWNSMLHINLLDMICVCVCLVLTPKTVYVQLLVCIFLTHLGELLINFSFILCFVPYLLVAALLYTTALCPDFSRALLSNRLVFP